MKKLNIISNYLNDSEFIIIFKYNNIHIINYKKIKTLNSNIIEILNNNKLYKIIGENLVILKLNPRELIINGIIKELKYE